MIRNFDIARKNEIISRSLHGATFLYKSIDVR